MQKVVVTGFILLMMAGCTSARKGFSGTANTAGKETLTLKEITDKNLTNSDFIISKAEIIISTKEEKSNFIAVVKYKTGGIYLISIRSKSGIEAARAYIDKDTVLVNDRINKKIYYGSSSYLKGKYGIEADHLAMLLGDLLINDDEEKEMMNCINGETNYFSLSGSTAISYNIDCMKGKVSSANISKTGLNSEISIKYEGFRHENMFDFPSAITAETKNGEMEVIINIKKAEPLSGSTLKFIPGENYERIRLK